MKPNGSTGKPRTSCPVGQNVPSLKATTDNHQLVQTEKLLVDDHATTPTLQGGVGSGHKAYAFKNVQLTTLVKYLLPSRWPFCWLRVGLG